LLQRAEVRLSAEELRVVATQFLPTHRIRFESHLSLVTVWLAPRLARHRLPHLPRGVISPTPDFVGERERAHRHRSGHVPHRLWEWDALWCRSNERRAGASATRIFLKRVDARVEESSPAPNVANV